ncbi:unnamed protein product [Enterobius vermicularis]|uniref:SET domain-containing protein n=1 Tax=Enterobius vermicularis TaxID=51028 RepID=A0A0N4VRQ3_ENTVE|nr:unnamed protein product [Enterobius vermicularis]
MGTQIAAAQPLIPVGKVPRTMVPMSCRAPMCNPYVHNYALGIEYDFGGGNGVEDNDNLTVTYGQEFGNVDPYYSLFEYQKYLPGLYANEPSRQREICGSVTIL